MVCPSVEIVFEGGAGDVRGYRDPYVTDESGVPIRS
jgi:hypothetical protein